MKENECDYCLTPTHEECSECGSPCCAKCLDHDMCPDCYDVFYGEAYEDDDNEES